MATRDSNQFKTLKKRTSVFFLHMRLLIQAIAKSARLPPGRLDPQDVSMHTDQRFSLKRAKSLGPIFKTMWNGQYTTCVIGHARARRLLTTNEENFPGATIDLTRLFPIGALRGMSGETHQKYRRLFILALQATPLAANEAVIREWIFRRLTSMAKGSANAPIAGPDLRAGLREITTGVMLRVLFGVSPEGADYGPLVQEYRAFGPNFPAYEIKPADAETFARIRQRVEKLAERIRRGPPDAFPPSFLKYLVESDVLDQTALGNLMYMFEPSHFDLYSLWRWILKYLSASEEIIARVNAASGDGVHELCEAIVLETLRLEQGEELYRKPASDVVFENYMIPKDTIMRARIWEGHKDPDIFPDPFKFNPDRFIGRTYPFEQYAPFGLDKRRCVGADFVVGLSTMFVEILLKNFTIAPAADGPPVFGAYHWEPNPEFSITVAVRQESRAEGVMA